MSIVIDRVTKSFGNVVAISEVSATIGAGVTALLGPNGAGKSTLFRLMCGLTEPTLGSITVMGQSVRHSPAVRGQIGLVPQQDALFETMSAHQFVRLAAITHQIEQPDAATEWALDQVALADVGTKPVRDFSKGMRQRVKIAAGIVNNPSVIILDEPLNGLDPVQRRHLTALFRRLGNEGKTVVVSSHVLDEVARLGSQVLVIAQGRLAATGDFRELRKMMDDRPQTLHIVTDRAFEVGAELLRVGIVNGVSASEGALRVTTNDIERLRVELAPVTQRVDASLIELRPLDDDLESVFRYLVNDQ